MTIRKTVPPLVIKRGQVFDGQNKLIKVQNCTDWLGLFILDGGTIRNVKIVFDGTNRLAENGCPVVFSDTAHPANGFLDSVQLSVNCPELNGALVGKESGDLSITKCFLTLMGKNVNGGLIGGDVPGAAIAVPTVPLSLGAMSAETSPPAAGTFGDPTSLELKKGILTLVSAIEEGGSPKVPAAEERGSREGEGGSPKVPAAREGGLGGGTVGTAIAAPSRRVKIIQCRIFIKAGDIDGFLIGSDYCQGREDGFTLHLVCINNYYEVYGQAHIDDFSRPMLGMLGRNFNVNIKYSILRDPLKDPS